MYSFSAGVSASDASFRTFFRSNYSNYLRIFPHDELDKITVLLILQTALRIHNVT